MSDRITAVRNELSVIARAADSAKILADGIEAQVAEATEGMISHVNGIPYLCGVELTPIAINDPRLRTGSLVCMPDFSTVGDFGTAKRFIYVEQYHRGLLECNLLFWEIEGANNMAAALIKVAKKAGTIG